MVILAFLLAAATPYVPIYDAKPARAALAHPVPQLRQIRWMAGTWRCHMHSFATGAVPAHDYGTTTYVGKFIVRNALSGERTWLQFEDAGQRDLSFITYDPMATHWVVTGIEWPISYGTQTGSMNGSRLVLTGTVTVFGRSYRIRTTYTKRNANAFSLVNEEQLPSGRWLPDDEYDFVRIKK